MRMVLDTNVVISGLLWSGVPRELLRLAYDGRVDLVSSEPLLEELRETLQYRKFLKRLSAASLTVEEVTAQYRLLTDVVQPLATPRVTHDPDDDVVLGTAVAGQANVVVSGDGHLLQFGQYAGVVIRTPAQVFAFLGLTNSAETGRS